MKIVKRNLRRIIKEELQREWSSGSSFHGERDQEDPQAGYTAALKALGPEKFVAGLIAALGDMSGYTDGHAGIIDYIERYS
jgi:hypothetical protein